MRTLRRWLVRSVVLCVTISLFGGGWLAIDRWTGQREWHNYREAALARGEKLTYRDYLPPSVPTEENYVTGTIFERVGLKSPAEAVPERPLKLPAPKNLNPKATLSERLEATKDAMLEAGLLDRENLPSEPGRAVLLGLNRFQAQLDELRATRRRLRCRFPQSELPPPKTVFPQVMLAMDVASLFALQIDAHLAVAEPAAALESLRDGVRLHQAMIDEPTMIAGLGRKAVLSVLLQAVDRGLSEQLWEDGELRQIFVLLDSIDLAADARRAFSSERGFINDANDSLRVTPIWDQVAQFEALDILEEMPRGWRLWISLCSGDPWRRQMRENQVLDHRLTQFKAGLDGAFENPPPENVAKERHLTSLTDMLGKHYVALEMALRQSRLVCALERFRRARDTYPLELAELVPDLIPAIPSDVIDGQPVRYRRTEPNKFLLYSVGANRQDDAGSAVFDRRARGAFRALDWVWGEPWK